MFARNQMIERNSDGTVTVSGRCVFTGEQTSVTVKASEFDAWQSGGLIQVVMPSATDDEREFLISGISPKGWAETFGGN